MYASWKGEIIGSSTYGSRPFPWVARLTGLDNRWGFKREFLRGIRDFTYGKPRHTRGVWVYFSIPPGLYEFMRAVSWKHEERFFARVTDDGEIVKISKEEVIECMKNECSE